MIKIPIILGLPFHLWLGISALVLVILQVATGKRLLAIPFAWHRRLGYVLLLLALMHGVSVIGLYRGLFKL